MRIRRSTAPPTSSVSPSSCSSSSSSSCFSSSQHSTISSHSLTSSSNSTSSSSSPSLSLSSSPSRRCEGLDLLVKAVFHVHSSVIGVPYIQRRIIRRRKPALHFTNLVISSSNHKFDPLFHHHHLGLGVVDVDVDVVDDHDHDDGVLDCLIQNNDKMKMKMKMKSNINNKSKKRSKAVPVKYQDSVLESWKPKDRRRRSTKV